MGGRGSSFGAEVIRVMEEGGRAPKLEPLIVAGMTPTDKGSHFTNEEKTLSYIEGQKRDYKKEQLQIIDEYGYVTKAYQGDEHSVGLTAEAAAYRTSLRKIDGKKREINSQMEHIAEADADLPEDLMEGKEYSEALEQEVKNDREPVLDVAITICLASDNADSLEEKAATIRNAYEDMNFVVERPIASQIKLYMQCIPSVRGIVRDYVMHLAPMTLASGVIGAIHELGDKLGPYIGSTGREEKQVYLDMGHACLLNHSASASFTGDGTEDAVSLGNRLNILQIQNLKLPSPETPKEDYTNEETLSTVLMMVVSHFARIWALVQRKTFKCILFDESWALGKTAKGVKLYDYLARMGRSLYTGVIFNGHTVLDIPTEDIKNTITYKFCFHTGNDAEAARMCDYLGIQDTEDNREAIKSLGNGQCFFRDLAGHVGILQFDAVFEDIIETFSTTPETEEQQAEEARTEELQKKERKPETRQQEIKQTEEEREAEEAFTNQQRTNQGAGSREPCNHHVQRT